MSECSIADPQHCCSVFSSQNTSAPSILFHLHCFLYMSWRASWMQPNAASLPSYHSSSAGGRCRKVLAGSERSHWSPLFLTDFSLSTWLHFCQQQSRGSHSQRLILSRGCPMSSEGSFCCPRRGLGVRSYALAIPLVLLLVYRLAWCYLWPASTLISSSWAQLGKYHKPGTFPSREDGRCHLVLGRRVFLDAWAWVMLVHSTAEQEEAWG